MTTVDVDVDGNKYRWTKSAGLVWGSAVAWYWVYTTFMKWTGWILTVVMAMITDWQYH